MPRPRRSVPQAQMSLFSQPQGSRRQNDRWIANATVTVEDLLKATERTAEELYGLETDYQRPLDRAHCAAIAKYYLAARPRISFQRRKASLPNLVGEL